MRNVLKSNKGFTLAEVMVAAGLMGVVLLFSVQFFNNVNKSNTKVADDLIETLGRLQMSKALNFDFENARYSFNALNLKDDNGDIFYDYYFDSPCMKDCTRSFTLDVPTNEGGVSKSFYMITADRTYGKDIVYTPTQAYRDTSLTFVSLNQKGHLASRAFSPWIKGKLLFLYSTSVVRKDGADPQVVPPRHISFLGWVTNTGATASLKRETVDDGPNSYFNRFDPRNGQEISTEDVALRRVPYIHGLSNDMFLTSVNLVRYRLKTERVGNRLAARLYRGVKKVGSDYHEIAVGEGIKSLKFVRDNVSRGEVMIELEMDNK